MPMNFNSFVFGIFVYFVVVFGTGSPYITLTGLELTMVYQAGLKLNNILT